MYSCISNIIPCESSVSEMAGRQEFDSWQIQLCVPLNIFGITVSISLIAIKANRLYGS